MSAPGDSAAPARHVDVLVIGSGPAGQQAATVARRAGRAVLVVEKDRSVGGACVHSGTIPSKTLRETAVQLAALPARSGGQLRVELDERVQLQSLMRRLDQVVTAHTDDIAERLLRENIDLWRGRARFLDAHHVVVERPRGGAATVRADLIVIATGSRPRKPDGVPVDHENVLDSDSLLAMAYLPRSLVVLGGGVIASEYASTFATLGVEVTMVDRAPRPLAFLDPELSALFVERFDARPGCRYFGGRQVADVAFDRVSQVVTRLDDGTELRSEKVLSALGRVANVEHLGAEAAGLRPNPRGYLEVDEFQRTAVPHIYAVGDVVGPPALASSSMAQGRRAMLHALGMPEGPELQLIPTGIYTVPEMACVGLTEPEARKQGEVVVGRASFGEIARGHIACATDGFLKLVARAEDGRLLGAHVLGEGATELVHLAEMAMLGGLGVHTFVDRIFNFPTFADAYRVAAERAVAEMPVLATAAR